MDPLEIRLQLDSRALTRPNCLAPRRLIPSQVAKQLIHPIHAPIKGGLPSTKIGSCMIVIVVRSRKALAEAETVVSQLSVFWHDRAFKETDEEWEARLLQNLDKRESPAN